MFNDSFNATSRDYADMSRNASREYHDIERARNLRKETEVKKQIALSIEKANILKQLELGLITKEEALIQLASIEEHPKSKKLFFK